MTAPAIVRQIARPGLPVPYLNLSSFDSRTVSRAMTLFALGELIGDKLPFMPKRTQTASLIFRAISGGLSGAVVCSSNKRSVMAGALIGMAAAVGATFGAYELRRQAGTRFHIPDWPIALLEDAVAAGFGALVVSKLGSKNHQIA